MPGKINPVIPEVANQVCFQIMGADQTIATASEAAQLQLNVFEPVIVYNLLNNLKIMTNALNTLRTKCVDGITANEDACKKSVDNSIGIVTALLPLIGYKKASAVAKEALETGAPVRDDRGEIRARGEGEGVPQGRGDDVRGDDRGARGVPRHAAAAR